LLFEVMDALGLGIDFLNGPTSRFGFEALESGLQHGGSQLEESCLADVEFLAGVGDGEFAGDGLEQDFQAFFGDVIGIEMIDEVGSLWRSSGFHEVISLVN
jgi:hypothetical protein